jgi:hypothetical protein
VDSLLVDDHIEFSMISYFRFGIHWMGVILDSRCDPLRNYILWTQSGNDDRMNMIRVAHHHPGGSFLMIAWDPVQYETLR